MKHVYQYLVLMMGVFAYLAVSNVIAAFPTTQEASEAERKEGAETITEKKALVARAMAGVLTKGKKRLEENVGRLGLREQDRAEKEEIIASLELVLEALIKPLFDYLEVSKDKAAARNLRKIFEKTLEESLGKKIWQNPDLIPFAIDDIQRPLAEGVFAQLLRLLQENKMEEAVILTRTAYRGSSGMYGLSNFKIADFRAQFKRLLARLLYMGLYGAARPCAFMFDDMDSSNILVSAQQIREDEREVLKAWIQAGAGTLEDIRY